MNVLIVFAHPEPRSLSGSLAESARRHLVAAGHHVEVSDLYAMRWKATLDAEDFPERSAEARLDPTAASLEAFARGTQPADVAAEQAKLLGADVVLFHFPLWWFTVPAILKGWFDRVYAAGFAYAVGEHSDTRWGDRYGEGVMRGKRAMLVVTTGGWAEHYGPRGINGPIDDLLFPIHHGLLFYPGFDVLPPFLVHRASKVDASSFARIEAELALRLDTLATTPPIPYRRQNFGDYAIPTMTLRDELAPGVEGFRAHRAD